MKILHTSDWHLGRALYGRKRYKEHSLFLDWLYELILREKVDILLVAGDIFDTTTPSNKAQELYYKFLCRVAAAPVCEHIVIIAGNHDSPSFLTAPRELLKNLQVHVTGTREEKLDDEVLLLNHRETGNPQAIVCAVPYLRDREIRTAEAGESAADKYQKLIAGIEEHYQQIADIARKIRQQTGKTNVPIIGMGHLFAAGGKTCKGDGVRELYVGSLAYLNVHNFAEGFDYLALGHLHVPQTVGGLEHVRYSGSPIPIGFGEANQRKSVVVVEFTPEDPPAIKDIPIPRFQELARVTGDMGTLLKSIAELKEQNKDIWLEIEYSGKSFQPELREKIEEAAAESLLQILIIKDNRLYQNILETGKQQENLEDLDVYQVFERCLEAHQVHEDEKEQLIISYKELVQELYEQDNNSN